jgi:Protein-L-isoaspartate carboxylmethyltransferase
VADKAIADGDQRMNQDRKTNTARRAGMAASAYAQGAADEADGRTLHSIADAVEIGAGGPLAQLTSRAQLQTLKNALNAGRYETDKRLTYSEQLQGRGRETTEEDIRNVALRPPLVWANRYRDAAVTIAKRQPKGNSKLIAALTKLSQGREQFPLTADGDIAITRKAHKVLQSLGETWTLKDTMESLARHDRLARMGITNTVELQEACRALLPHLAARKEESAVAKAERAIIGQKVGIDFFPTPAHVAQRMATLARIGKGDRVLEPSAGNGNLADAAAAAGGTVDVIEISSQLRDILSAKGYNVVDHDFMGFTPEEPYQAILMNPPFSNRQDAAHIMRAFGMLQGGGTLVAIAGEGVFFGQDQKAEQFRNWLDQHGADVEKLEGGTFQDDKLLAQTSANARLIVLRK